MMSPKIQVNIGIPQGLSSFKTGLDSFEKMVEFCNVGGASIICDMSSHLERSEERSSIIQASGIPRCSVPIYEYHLRYGRDNGYEIKIQPFLKILDGNIENGVQYFLLHSAFNRTVFDSLGQSERLIKIASRGGGIHFRHFLSSIHENPLYEYFDLILDRLRCSSTTLILGAATRPGSVCDGLDKTFKQEMFIQSKLVREAELRGVRVIVEGVGHTTIPDLISWVKLARSIFGNVPLKPLPIPTDIGAALDNVGHAISVYYCTKMGVEYVCCISPAEHLGSPSPVDVQIGIASAKLAIHTAMLHDGSQVIEADRLTSLARAENDWDTLFASSIDPDLACKKFWELNKKSSSENCTMCGELCPKLIVESANEGRSDRRDPSVSDQTLA